MNHTRWSRNLGAPRVQLELGEELTALGCRVTKFSREDAFAQGSPPRRRNRILAILAENQASRKFSRQAVAWLRTRAGQFDVIEANQTDLPVPKSVFGFAGLVVTRSVGLIPKYFEFERWAETRWPQPMSARGHVHRILAYPAMRRRRLDVVPSFRHADLINVSNRDDLATVADEMGFGEKVVMFPFGLSAERRQALWAAQAGPAERLAQRTVAFIGTWNSRKGAGDWPLIATRLLATEPRARILLLGTGIAEAVVLGDFPPDVRHALTIVPGYDSGDLPGLLATATVGAFPGYLEGFGFSVLEKLAAGLPTVTYDAPGPRDIMAKLERPRMVAPGDVDALVHELAILLALGETDYAAAAADANRAASCFSWSEIARATLGTYLDRRDRLPKAGAASTFLA